MNQWRFLFYSINSAVRNMAVDEAIFRASQHEGSMPTLRFYGWEPAAVSIGFFQDLSLDINIEACRSNKIHIVRRITGGRAVFHSAELTYSIIGREEDPKFPAGILNRYRIISECISSTLSHFGVQAEMKKERRNSTEKNLDGFCFSAPSQYELLVNGKKICGSAQARSNGSFLQHGSLLIDLDPSLTCALMSFDKTNREEKIADIEKTTTCINFEVNRSIYLNDLCAVLAASFESKFAIRLIPGTLNSDELSMVDNLIENKYGTDSWNYEAKSSI